MSVIIDDDTRQLDITELLIAILAELQVMNMHLEQTTDVQFTVNDTDDGYNSN